MNNYNPLIGRVPHKWRLIGTFTKDGSTKYKHLRSGNIFYIKPCIDGTVALFFGNAYFGNHSRPEAIKRIENTCT